MGAGPKPRPPSRLSRWLGRHEDSTGLAAFRVLFGIVMLVDAARFLAYGWVTSHFLRPKFLFKYVGFEWVEPMAPWAMYALFWGLAIAGFTVAIGYAYRFSCAFLFVGHTYAFLLAGSHYLNHAYLICLLCFMMIWLPAHHALSIDALRDRSLRRASIPRWGRALLVGQLWIVYTYASVAKFNPDWLSGMPLRRWLEGSARGLRHIPILAETIRTEWALWVISYGGIAFDFLIVPALLWKRTRAIAVLCAVGFHVSNVFLFNIGVFPWLMLAATTLFFDPWWPRRIPGWDRLGAADLSLVLRRLREFLQTPRSRLRWGAFVGGMLVLFPLLAVSSAFAVALHAMVRSTAPAAAERPKGSPVYDAIDLLPRRIVIFFCVWLAAQLLIPLRHHLYPGNVAWTEEGHMFSWRMKLRSKRGSVRFHAEDRQSGRRWEVDPRQELSSRQIRKMAGRPDFIRQYAVHLAERYRQQGLDVKVTAEARTSLNYRKRRTFIDPEVDLGRERGSILPYRWVTDMPDDPVPER